MKDRRVILITGATGGLGQTLAQRFGQAGCRIVVHYFRNKESAESLADHLNRSGAEVILQQADVRSLDAVRSMTEAALKKWDRLDVLIASAGVREDGLVIRSSEDSWDIVLRTNLTGVWNCLKAVGPPMMRQQSGHVIAIGSIAGLHGRAGQANYAASKAGLLGLLRSVAAEWGTSNIRLNLILPGLQPTGMTERLSSKQKQALMRQNLLDRTPSMTDVAEFVYQLSKASGITGQVFNLDSRIL